MTAEDVVRRGRLSGDRDARIAAFLSSMAADRTIAGADVLVDIAHALMLLKQGIIGSDAGRLLLGALLTLYREGVPDEAFDDRFEDIHAGIESMLISAIGEGAGGRLHTARSRNDEVATCIRIALRDAVLVQTASLITLRGVLLDVAQHSMEAIMPGFTHMQHAQPTTLAHHLLAYEAAFTRDTSRMTGAYGRVNRSPLGAAAFAGTTYPIDARSTAVHLGFSSTLGNTMDAVAGRDVVLEVLAHLAVMMTSVSRLCEDLILWSSRFIGFVRLADAYCSTSSIMPQKRNPDTVEIMRAKAGSVIGACSAAMVITKGLPMSYNRDLQEITPHLWRAISDARESTDLLAGVLETAVFDLDRMRLEAGQGSSTATDLADHLVQNAGLPFRTAHSIVGRAVAKGGLDPATLHAATMEITGNPPGAKGMSDSEVAMALDPERSVAMRSCVGGPAPVAVRATINEERACLEGDAAWAAHERGRIDQAIAGLIRDAEEMVKG
jgi:argininosuccinate lyase